MKKSIFFLTFLITTLINHSHSANKNTDDHKKSKPESASKMMDEILKNMQEEDEELSEQSVDGQLSEKDFDLIRQHIRTCALSKFKREEIKNIIISFELELSPNGTVTNVKVIDICDTKEILNHKDLEAISNKFKDLFLLPGCSPFPLPAEKYHLWKKFAFRINSSEF